MIGLGGTGAQQSKVRHELLEVFIALSIQSGRLVLKVEDNGEGVKDGFCEDFRGAKWYKHRMDATLSGSAFVEIHEGQ